jgi:hypothetical protein
VVYFIIRTAELLPDSPYSRFEGFQEIQGAAGGMAFRKAALCRRECGVVLKYIELLLDRLSDCVSMKK